MKILNLYSSATGNTEKIALSINKAFTDNFFDVTTINVMKDDLVDILEFDVIFVGSGVYAALPHKAMNDYLKKLTAIGMKEVDGVMPIMPASPRLKNKYAVVYCTYGGAHTGINEAIPAVKYIGQLFDHYGFPICDEWYIVGEFVPEKMAHFNTNGRLGNIQGRPNKNDLDEVYQKTVGFINTYLN